MTLFAPGVAVDPAAEVARTRNARAGPAMTSARAAPTMMAPESPRAEFAAARIRHALSVRELIEIDSSQGRRTVSRVRCRRPR